jgi:hypothetical protein
MLTAKKSPLSTRFIFLPLMRCTSKRFRGMNSENRRQSSRRCAIRAMRWKRGLTGLFIGLSGCWQFSGYSYIEHLAIDDTLRSRGYGKRLLAGILERAPLTILEIDPLTSDIAHKRLRFYETMGFRASSWPHLTRYHAGIADHCWCWATLRRLMKRSIGAEDLRQVVIARVRRVGRNPGHASVKLLLRDRRFVFRHFGIALNCGNFLLNVGNLFAAVQQCIGQVKLRAGPG